MERLTIDEIIGHCNRKARMYEKACDIKYLETTAMSNSIKEYWEHKQVAGYLKKLKDYEDAEEHGLLLRLPISEDAPVYSIEYCCGKTKVIGLECVLEDFARIVVIRRTTYVKA